MSAFAPFADKANTIMLAALVTARKTFEIIIILGLPALIFVYLQLSNVMAVEFKQPPNTKR